MTGEETVVACRKKLRVFWHSSERTVEKHEKPQSEYSNIDWEFITLL